MKLGLAAGMALAGALAIGGVAVTPAQAALQNLTVDLDVYDTSAVDPTPGLILGVMTVQDLVGGGVSVDFALDPLATLFASTGGGHITVGFNLDTAITAVTITSPTGAGAPTFTFQSPDNGVPGPSGGFGNFSAGLQGNWNGTSDHFAGPIDFTIAGVSVSDFEANTKGFFAVADVLGSKGTGEVGGNMGTIVGTPEPSTWAMMLIGFAGLGFAGYRKAHSARTALPAA
jgi:PEP-CTERM motif